MSTISILLQDQQKQSIDQRRSKGIKYGYIWLGTKRTVLWTWRFCGTRQSRFRGFSGFEIGIPKTFLQKLFRGDLPTDEVINSGEAAKTAGCILVDPMNTIGELLPSYVGEVEHTQTNPVGNGRIR
jgi:hypothetical protein